MKKGLLRRWLENFKQKEPDEQRRIIIWVFLAFALILVFDIGFLLGAYLRGLKVAPLEVNLGGLEKSIIQADELKSKIRWGDEIYIYDLRSKSNFEAGRIRNAVSMPIADLPTRIQEIPKEKEVVIYCQNFSCEEAPQAVATLDKLEHKNFRTLFGGVEQWTSSGYKLIKN